MANYSFDNIKISSHQELLQHVSEEDILTHYYGPWEPNVHMYCPFQEEKNPSFFVSYYNQKLVWRRFGLYNRPQDVINFVMIKFKLNYCEAINKIYEDLVINKKETLSTDTLKKLRSKTSDQYEMAIVKKDWEDYDLEYWLSYDGFDIDVLQNRFNVFPAKEYWSNQIRKHVSSREDPLYCYDHSLETGHQSFTAYRPYADRNFSAISGKFRKYMTRHHIMNYNNLSGGNVAFITSSYKDIIAFHVLGFDACALHTEEDIFPREALENLVQLYPHVYVAYDNDATGVRQSLKLTQNNNDLGLKYFNVPKYLNSKDPSDVLKNYDRFVLLDLISEKFYRDGVLC